MHEILLWVIVLAPLVASCVIALAATMGLKEASPWPCLLALLISSGAAILLALQSAHQTVRAVGYPWIDVGHFTAHFSLRADSLTLTMLVTVTCVSLLIAIYSIGYLHGHVGFARFFASLSLFVFSMTLLVSAGNFLVLFLAWEAVGLCSYLLIGYYQDRPSAAAAARKAFLVNRVGDLGFLIGILWLWSLVGRVAPMEFFRLDFETVFALADKIAAQDPAGLTGACFFLFAGAVGKSAQFPLHVWLPDAMEGPSPVSALIHAATMVTAGVYFVARLSPLLEHTPIVQVIIACIGGFTALLAAGIAVTQTDLKRVLAYSTVSQLGFMFVALGCPAADENLMSTAVSVAIFHLFTHAFFKALLFLSAGSVMHAMGDIIDMRQFSGLRKSLPYTHALFLCGAVALAGLPIFSGFWSKDGILGVLDHAAKHEGGYRIYFQVIQSAIFVTSFLTAFYTFRAYFMTFWGRERFPPEAGKHPHESPAIMLAPMAALAIPALFIGLLVGPGVDFRLGQNGPQITLIPADLFGHFVLATTPGVEWHGPHLPELAVMFWSTILAVGGLLVAWQFYVRRPSIPAQWAESAAPLYQASANRFYFDEIYDMVVVRPIRQVSSMLPKFDRHWLDKTIDIIGAMPRWVGAAIRGIQNGFVQGYALWMLLGVVILAILAVGGKE